MTRDHVLHGLQPALIVRSVDRDGLFATYKHRGARIVFASTTQSWQLREFAILDADDHRLIFAQTESICVSVSTGRRHGG